MSAECPPYPDKRTSTDATSMSAWCQQRSSPPFAERDVMEYWMGTAASVRLDVGRPDHLAPLLSFVGNELSKVGGRTREHRTSQVGEALLHVGIGESGIDLLVELLDNLRGRGFGHDDPVPASRLEARQKFAHGRDI